MAYAVEMRRISKRFPGVVANDAVDLAVERGEIRALVGENGAGKTTLMRVLYGLERADAGEIRVGGRRRRFSSSRDAIRAGLGMVHQHFMLFPSLTVAENVVFGAEPRSFGMVDRRRASRELCALCERFSLPLDPSARAAELPIGQRQRLEILKALYRGAEVLILDEPTAVLTPAERDGLFAVLERLAAAGKTVLFVTHKLQEVLRLSHRTTVLRDGALVATLETAGCTAAELSRLIVGRDLAPPQRPSGDSAGPVLEVRRLVVPGIADRGRQGEVSGLSLDVRGGEVVGIAAAAGSGQERLVEAIVGLRSAAGSIRLGGSELVGSSVASRRTAGLAYVPEDRDRTGLALEMSVRDNLIMGSHRREPVARRGILCTEGAQAAAERLLAGYDVRLASADQPAAELSGGNRQKLVVARELALSGGLLIAEQPTRGLDAGAAAAIRRRILDYRAGGGAVLLVSADLEELLELSDRILVMLDGAIVGEIERERASEEWIGLLMTGAASSPAENG